MAYIVEHQTRGVFMEWDGTTPRWSWNATRREATQFLSAQEALRTYDRLIAINSNGRFKNLLSIRDANDGYREVDVDRIRRPLPRDIANQEQLIALVQTHKYSYSDVERIVTRAFQLYDTFMAEDQARLEAKALIIEDFSESLFDKLRRS